MSYDEFVAIVPAAGRSRRMGTPKPLVPLIGRPMLLATLEPLLGIDGLVVVVVTTTEVSQTLDLEASGVTVTLNDDPEAEMIDSIRLGIAAGRSVRPDAAGCLVLPGDQPETDAADIRRCLDRFREDPTRIVIASHADRRGHPLILPGDLVDRVGAATCDGGLNRLVDACADRISLIDCVTPTVVRNVNTPRDLEDVEGQRP